ncbi:type IV secretion system DNA-binding domain-containing protein [Gluconacetobacter diazotrophicus]|uniref:Type IV secretion system DNA-binding domain-containing protein n=1 Tax=Gluconacetobacter diazotrophicus TaxID=33996 RepID=A0A7W4FF47_GLUDI|nr:type IV secretion system DNA-binding domain-containing protein [Gluconacetobacter diazotrophicus]MBB2156606.1 type IV secretion system DNA-binding domain-containing protein [Gluconacetobacter diazotrophicus]
MAIIRRRIDGPQDFHEQTGGLAYRDARSLSAHLADTLTSGFSAIGLGALATATFLSPALTSLTVPVASLYAALVMTRAIRLPLRLPGDCKRKDFENPVPLKGRVGVDIPGPAKGDYLIGWDESSRQQVWLSGRDDLTMHGILPGATGSGKTQFIYSLLCSTLAQGSGFTIIDGKASNNLPFTIAALARRYGREADVRILNMLVSSGDRKTNTWNPFSTVNAEGMTELLLTLFLPEEGGGGSSKFFSDRADALIRGMAHVFVWVRDNLQIPMTSETIRAMFSDIEALRELVDERKFRYYDFAKEAFDTCSLDAAQFPAALLDPVRFYIKETGGFSAKATIDAQAKVREQHGYVVGGFAKAFTQMSSTLGHIFKCNVPDIDFRDVIYNRRILIVLLPSLENHPETNAALGRAVITAYRYAMAAALGTSIEGTYEDLVENRPSSAHTPYIFIADEVGYFAARGLDLMMAQGRELNMSIWLSFQEVGSLYATLGRDRAVPLLGNPKLKIFENIEDAGPTREWVESTGGTMQVSVLPGYDTSSTLGLYRDQQRADIREVKRISWSDIQSLRQGQAIVLFRGKRIYTRLFYAGITASGEGRIFPTIEPRRDQSRPSAISPPIDPKHPMEDISKHIAAGEDIYGVGDLALPNGVLAILYEGLSRIVDLTASPLEDAYDLLRGLDLNDEPHPFANLFSQLPVPSPARTGIVAETPHERVDPELIDELVTFEVEIGAAETEARARVIDALNSHAQGQVRT